MAWKHTIVGQSIIEGTPFAAAMIKDGVDETSVEGAADLPYDGARTVAVDLHSPKGVGARSSGGARSATPTPASWSRASSTSWRTRPARIPTQYRRALLGGHPRHLGVLDLAAAEGGLGHAAARRPRAAASRCTTRSAASCAQVAEVSVAGARIRVHRVVCAIDCGRAVNPETIRAQMEGGIVFGLSAALYGQITLKDGRVQQSNFHDYPVLRIDEMPEVEVHIVPSTEPPSGIGEPGTPLMAAAVCNALFALTGRRIRSLPLVRHGFESA